jgi:hypothetical protein
VASPWGGPVRHERRVEPRVKTDETRDGLLGSLGMNETRDVASLLCPGCGRLRLYAETDA